MSSSPKVLFGFHAVGVRMKVAPESIVEVYFEASRRDARMRQFIDRAKQAEVRLIEARPEKPREIGRFQASGSGARAVPAVARGRFFLRDRSHLLCLELPR